jgi:hypothetical protein
VYQPEMTEENVRRLYYLKVEKRKPMTKLLNQILEEYFQQHEPQDKSEEGGKTECTSAKSAETPSKSNGSKKGRTSTTSDTSTAPSAEPNTTP